MTDRNALFARKLSGAQHCYRRLFALGRDHGDLDLAFLNMKNGVGGVALGKNRCVLGDVYDHFPQPRLGEKIGYPESCVFDPSLRPFWPAADDGCSTIYASGGLAITLRCFRARSTHSFWDKRPVFDDANGVFVCSIRHTRGVEYRPCGAFDFAEGGAAIAAQIRL